MHEALYVVTTSEFIVVRAGVDVDLVWEQVCSRLFLVDHEVQFILCFFIAKFLQGCYCFMEKIQNHTWKVIQRLQWGKAVKTVPNPHCALVLRDTCGEVILGSGQRGLGYVIEWRRWEVKKILQPNSKNNKILLFYDPLHTFEFTTSQKKMPWNIITGYRKSLWISFNRGLDEFLQCQYRHYWIALLSS